MDMFLSILMIKFNQYYVQIEKYNHCTLISHLDHSTISKYEAKSSLIINILFHFYPQLNKQKTNIQIKLIEN